MTDTNSDAADSGPSQPAEESDQGVLTPPDGTPIAVLDSDPGLRTAEEATKADVAAALDGEGPASSFEPTDAESIDIDKMFGQQASEAHMAAKLASPDIGAMPPTVPASAEPAQNAALHSAAFGQAFATRDNADEKWDAKQRAIAQRQVDDAAAAEQAERDAADAAAAAEAEPEETEAVDEVPSP